MRRWPLTLLIAALALAACQAPRRPGDTQILLAQTEEERQVLREAREDLEQQKEQVLRAKDAEIARLQAENARLTQQLAATR